MTDSATRRSKQRENQIFFSGKLSELSRYIAFGVIAVYFTILSSDGKLYDAIRLNAINTIRTAAVLAILVVILDFLQMMCGLIASNTAADNKDGDYKRTLTGDIFYSVQQWSFYLKQIVCLMSSASLMLGIYRVSFN